VQRFVDALCPPPSAANAPRMTGAATRAVAARAATAPHAASSVIKKA
jgi:hypothetical protein